MDQLEPVSKNIRNILDEISQNLHMKFDNLKKDIQHLKKKQMEQNRDFSLQNSALLSVFEEANRDSQALTNRRILLKKSLEKEETDLVKLEKENQEFQKQLDDLESVNLTLNENKQELLEKHRMLVVKLKQLKEKSSSKAIKYKEFNDLYKKFLGIEISTVKDNVIKISYKNLGTECYIILDFSKEETVTESLPELNIEKMNYLFKERKSFYEFVKCVRDQIKQKL